MTNLESDFSDGEVLLRLLEIVSGGRLLPVSKLRSSNASQAFKSIHSRENVNLVLTTMIDLNIIRNQYQLETSGLSFRHRFFFLHLAITDGDIKWIVAAVLYILRYWEEDNSLTHSTLSEVLSLHTDLIGTFFQLLFESDVSNNREIPKQPESYKKFT